MTHPNWPQIKIIIASLLYPKSELNDQTIGIDKQNL